MEAGNLAHRVQWVNVKLLCDDISYGIFVYMSDVGLIVVAAMQHVVIFCNRTICYQLFERMKPKMRGKSLFPLDKFHSPVTSCNL